MTKRKYCCNASQNAYDMYYMNQMGSGMPLYIGSRNQRGHGLGSILGGLFKSAVPIVKRGLSTLGKGALKTGLSIAGDVLDGKNVGDSARSRIAEGIKSFANERQDISPPRAKAVKRPAPQAHRNRRKTKRRIRERDIFD